MSRRLVATLALAILPWGLAACDLLMTEPAPPTPLVAVSLAMEGGDIGAVGHVFDKVRIAHLTFTKADSAVRDTTVRVFPRDGEARVRLSLETGERIPALLIAANLGVGAGVLFAGQRVVRIDVGKPTSAEIPISPVPSRIRASRGLVDFAAVGDTTRLDAEVLFVTGDAIPGWPHHWTSDDPTIVFVTAQGLSQARGVGQTRLLARSGDLTDTVFARVLAPG